MSNLVNVVKALLGSKFDVGLFEAKNRVFKFNYQKMNTFDSVPYLKTLCSTLFDEQFSR